MKIKINHGALLKAIKLTKGFVSKNEARPVLKNINIEASNDTITFSATDCYKGVKHEITDGIEVIESGSINVLPQQIEALLKYFVANEFEIVTLETSNDLKNLTISYASYQFTITTNLKTFPTLDSAMPKEDNLQEPTCFDKSTLCSALKSLAIVGNCIEIRPNKNEMKPTVIKAYNRNYNTGETTTALIVPIRRFTRD